MQRGHRLPDRETYDVEPPTLEDLCKTPVEKTVSIKIPNRKNCPFGESDSDNLSAKNGFLRARVESDNIIPITDGHVLCEIQSIESKPGQTIRYDDHLMLTFNDMVILSSFAKLDLLDKKDDLYQYAWLKLRGTDGLDLRDDFDSTPYCIEAEESCLIPPHDREGAFNLRLEQQRIDSLMKASGVSDTHKVSAVFFGDNDKHDCEIITSDGADLELNIQITETKGPE